MPTDAVRAALLAGDAGLARELVVAESTSTAPTVRRRAELVCERAFAAILDADFAVAHDLAVEAGEAADPLATALRVLASAMAGLGRDDVDPVARLADRLLVLTAEEVESSAWAVALGAEAAMAAGRLDLAESLARRAWTAAATTDPVTAVFPGQTLTRALLFQGRLEDAREAGVAVDALALAHGLTSLGLVVSGSLAYLAALAGDADELEARRDRIERSLPDCPRGYFADGALVLASYALATARRPAQAADMLLRAGGGPDLPRLQVVDRAYGYELLVTAALALGDVEAARGWAARAAALPGLRHDGMAGAALRRSEARLAVAEGDPSTGSALADRAAAMAQDSAGRLDATHARLLAGHALLDDVRHTAPARIALSAGIEQATELGATALALLARRDLRSIGLRLIGQDRPPMTRREREVADLLVTGLSDTAIAQRLGISVRTVQAHVGRVLDALDVSNRAAVTRRLVPGTGSPHDARLTPRQSEVATLVANGYTNAGVARALKISVKTVEKHLADVYARLSVTSRGSLAARWAGDGAEPVTD